MAEAAEAPPDGDAQVSMNGLSKSIFFGMLMQSGVLLDEHEKALVAAVFGMRNQHNDKLDYEKLDSAFEGV